ncbi:hypothetical protein NEOKW01_0571 [Nematocida sp. AWRm80]|nr:hypothetical protein NEOKW01_0571 [Nematocida sp. AWRm80]
MFLEVDRIVMAGGSIEIIGTRNTFKSVFVIDLINYYNSSNHILIITKGTIPVVNNTIIYTVSCISDLITILERYNSINYSGSILYIDSLSTIINTPEGIIGRNKVYQLISRLVSNGIRVIVISSVINIVKRTSDVYTHSIIFGKDTYLRANRSFRRVLK